MRAVGVVSPGLCQGDRHGESKKKSTYFQFAVRNPGAVARYGAAQLEMATALTAALLTEQLRSDDVNGLGDARAKIEAELVSRMGVGISVGGIPDLRKFGQVDDWYVTYGWGEGGIVHAHVAFLGRRRPARRQDQYAPRTSLLPRRGPLLYLSITILTRTTVYKAMQCNAVEINAMQCNARRNNSARFNTVQYDDDVKWTLFISAFSPKKAYRRKELLLNSELKSERYLAL